MLTKLWNITINAAGWTIGKLLRTPVRRQWLYFPYVSEAISTIPFSLGYKLRNAIYHQLLAGIGNKTILHQNVVIEDARCSIGSDVWISHGCYLDYVKIADSVLIGPNSVLLSGGRHHCFDRLDIPIKSQGNPEKEAINIGFGAWIGANVTLMASVGEGAIVGAGAVVTKEVPPFAVVAGNPAKLLYMRNAAAATTHSL
jgi:virginiamycin A acetyltransferase